MAAARAIFQLGVATGQYIRLQTLADLLQGTKMTKEEQRLALATILDLAVHGLSRQNLFDESREVEKIRDGLLYK